MLEWVGGVDGVLAALLALLLVVRLIIGHRLTPPRGVYLCGAVMGFCGWVAFVLSKGAAVYERRGTISIIWEQWVSMASLILPLEAGFLGWVAIRSRWRWCLLAAGMGVALFLPVVALIINLTHH
jgi:hypothetical protein